MNHPYPVKSDSLVIGAMLALGLILVGAAIRGAFTSRPTPPASPALTSINPNIAPWWELMVLPDIGETTARKIVEYRGGDTLRGRVFQTPADLDPVPGIGPKTIARMAPFLRFGE